MLGWLKKKIKNEELSSNVHAAFDRVKDELASQRKVVQDLHESHHDFRKATILSHQRMAGWITHFDQSIKRLEGDLIKLETRLRDETYSVSAQSAKRLEEVLERQKSELSGLKADLKREVEVFIADSKLEEPIINVDNANNVNNITPELNYDGLTNPEKWLVGVLFNAETPLSYAQVVEKTGKTVSTVRVYMNQLKMKGFIEESALPNGIKIFSLKHKAKVKKLYNL